MVITVKTAVINRIKTSQVFENKTYDAVERECIRVTGGVGGTIRNIVAIAKGETMAPDLATGFKFQEGGTDWLVENCKAIGFKTWPREGNSYKQGDGFATEIPNLRTRFVGCYSADCWDGGYDIKGADWRIEDCVAERCSKSFRLWSGGKATSMVSRDPAGCHLHIPTGADVQQVIEIGELIAEGAKPLLWVETAAGKKPPKILIKRMQLTNVSELLRFSGPKPDILWPG